MGLPGHVIEKRRKQLADQRKAKQQSLIQSLNLNEGVDADIAAATARTILPVSQPAYKRSAEIQKAAETKAFETAYKARTSEITKFVADQPVLKEAKAAGSDPRTISAIRKELIDTYVEGDVKAASIQGGKSQHRDVIKKQITEVERPKEIEKVTQKLKADVEVQPVLEQIRRRRRRKVKQTAASLTRRRGMGSKAYSLLADDKKNESFFGGYLKG
jgi:hypothetical protein